jgi:hypothetical protein
MQLLLARRLNNHKLPDCVTFVAATNKRSDRAGVSGILEPVKSRFNTIIHLETHVGDWIAWANRVNLRAEVIAYIRLRREVLMQYVPSADMENTPCPRTVASLSTLLDENHDPKDEFEVYAGAVGKGVAGEFIGFLKMFRDLDDPDSILLNPDTAKVPTEANALYATSAALASIANARNFAQVLTYAERMPQEFAVYCIKDATRRTPSVSKSPAWNKYISGPLGKLVAGEE